MSEQSSVTWPPGVSLAIERGLTRLKSELSSFAPALGDANQRWWETLGGERGLSSYFGAAHGFPVLGMPWWLAGICNSSRDTAFDEDVIYSTLSGYLYIRLVDDMMDGDAEVDKGMLPATAFYCSRFERPYRKYFPVSDPFWQSFDRYWLGGHDAVVQERLLPRIDEAAFRSVSVAKTTAAKVPLIATCLRYGRPDWVPKWEEYCERVSHCIQAIDDLLDWPLDAQRHPKASYLLTVAEERRRQDESHLEWFQRDGLNWGANACRQYLAELEASSAALGCEALVELWVARRAGFEHHLTDMHRALSAIMPVAKLLAGRRPAEATSI